MEKKTVKVKVTKYIPEQKEEEQTIYVAKDGTEFKDGFQCTRHEKYLVKQERLNKVREKFKIKEIELDQIYTVLCIPPISETSCELDITESDFIYLRDIICHKLKTDDFKLPGWYLLDINETGDYTYYKVHRLIDMRNNFLDYVNICNSYLGVTKDKTLTVQG